MDLCSTVTDHLVSLADCATDVLGSSEFSVSASEHEDQYLHNLFVASIVVDIIAVIIEVYNLSLDVRVRCGKLDKEDVEPRQRKLKLATLFVEDFPMALLTALYLRRLVVDIEGRAVQVGPEDGAIWITVITTWASAAHKATTYSYKPIRRKFGIVTSGFFALNVGVIASGFLLLIPFFIFASTILQPSDEDDDEAAAEVDPSFAIVLICVFAVWLLDMLLVFCCALCIAARRRNAVEDSLPDARQLRRWKEEDEERSRQRGVEEEEERKRQMLLRQQEEEEERRKQQELMRQQEEEEERRKRQELMRQQEKEEERRKRRELLRQHRDKRRMLLEEEEEEEERKLQEEEEELKRQEEEERRNSEEEVEERKRRVLLLQKEKEERKQQEEEEERKRQEEEEERKRQEEEEERKRQEEEEERKRQEEEEERKRQEEEEERKRQEEEEERKRQEEEERRKREAELETIQLQHRGNLQALGASFSITSDGTSIKRNTPYKDRRSQSGSIDGSMFGFDGIDPVLEDQKIYQRKAQATLDDLRSSLVLGSAGTRSLSTAAPEENGVGSDEAGMSVNPAFNKDEFSKRSRVFSNNMAEDTPTARGVALTPRPLAHEDLVAGIKPNQVEEFLEFLSFGPSMLRDMQQRLEDSQPKRKQQMVGLSPQEWLRISRRELERLDQLDPKAMHKTMTRVGKVGGALLKGKTRAWLNTQKDIFKQYIAQKQQLERQG